jgi:hypothetical protein
LTAKIWFLGSWNLYYTKCALMSFLSANGLHNQKQRKGMKVIMYSPAW